MNSDRLEITRILPADRDTVFKSLITRELMKKWFFAGPGWSVDVENDSRVGGHYSLLMRSPDGSEFATNGVYREIEPPRRLVFTWNSAIAQDSVVTVELETVEGGTRLTLTHDFLVTREAADNHRKGWTGCLDSLARLLEPNSI